MISNKWNSDWLFWVDRNAFALVWSTPEHAQPVTLPHDAMIAQPPRADSPNKGSTGYRDGEVLQYVKRFAVPDAARDRTWSLTFEGIHMNAFVYVNGALAAKRPFGYATFHVPLDEFLKYGEENEIRVTVRNGAMPNSRWYSGGGIYRDVWLREAGLVHVVPDGIRVTTESLDGCWATVRVGTTVRNRSHVPASIWLETVLVDPAGIEVAREIVPLRLGGGETRTMDVRAVVAEPKPWSADTPSLYRCECRVLKGDGESETADGAVRAHAGGALHSNGVAASGLEAASDCLDSEFAAFGIRTLSLDARRGLRVNGETVKLRGACIHHDSGLLGAATYEDAQYRQIRILKEAGFNAVRMSHHPMAPAMLRACDALGMYVMDEGFDVWTRCKSDYDFGLHFDEWWARELEAMVAKDYNHPSVVLYSMGNEIPELGNPHGAALCHRMHETVKALDPTRYTLSGINGVFMAGDAMDVIVRDVTTDLRAEGLLEGNVNHFMSLMDRHLDRIVVHPEITRRLDEACATTDIAGYNYMTARYETDGRERPNRVIVGSETYPPEIARNWALVERLPHLIGDFTWTGWDYIGEAGVGIPAYAFGEGGFGAQFPCQLAYCGDIDLTGFRRPASYLREIVFGLRKDPYIAVQDPNHFGQRLMKTPWVISDSRASWTWPGCEGKPVVVEVYAAGDEVELFRDGVSLGVKPAGVSVGFRTLFETTYEPGTLTAVCRRSVTAGEAANEVGNEAANGTSEATIGATSRATGGTDVNPHEETGRCVLTTASSARALHASVEHGRSSELAWVTIEAWDEAGTLATDAGDELAIEVEGDALLAGFGSGNPKDMPAQPASRTRLFQGRATAVLKMGGGTAAVRVSAEGYSDRHLEM